MTERQIDEAFKDIGALSQRLQELEQKQVDLEKKFNKIDGKVTVLITMNGIALIAFLSTLVALLLKRRITQKFYSTFILRL